MHNKFEDSKVEFDGQSNLQAIKSFVSSNVFGFCGHRTSGNSADFDAKPLVVVYYDVDYVKNPKGTNYWRNRYILSSPPPPPSLANPIDCHLFLSLCVQSYEGR